jgi:hypothetical protein
MVHLLSLKKKTSRKTHTHTPHNPHTSPAGGGGGGGVVVVVVVVVVAAARLRRLEDSSEELKGVMRCNEDGSGRAACHQATCTERLQYQIDSLAIWSVPIPKSS